jgi:hypothetical protein
VAVTAAADRCGEDERKDDEVEGEVEVDREEIHTSPSAKKQCVDKVGTGSPHSSTPGRST